MNTSFALILSTRLRVALALSALAALAACASNGAGSSQANTSFGGKSGVQVYGVVDTGYAYSTTRTKTTPP